MMEVFLLSQPFRVYLKHQPDFLTRTIKYIYYGTELLGFFGPSIREVVSTQLKMMESQIWHEKVAARNVSKNIKSLTELHLRYHSYLFIFSTLLLVYIL